jgi:Telomere resolvase
MSATAEHLVQWLQRNKDPENLVRWLCKRGVEYKTLCLELEQITNLWCEVYGDAAVQESEAYKSGVQRLDKRLHRMDKSIVQSVTKFLQLPFHQQFKLQAEGILHDYTGRAAIDAMLNELVVLPPYMQGLRVTCRASKSTTKVQHATQQAVSAKASSVSVPHAGASVTPPPVPALSTGAKRRRMSSPNREPAQKDGFVTKHKVSKVLQTVDMQAQLTKMLEVLQYSRAKPFELVCALAFVSGRSLAELMALGHFSSSTDAHSNNRASSHPEVLFALHRSQTENCCAIPLLCNTGTFLAGIGRLRQVKVVQDKECKDINKSHCKTANTAAKTLLGCSTAVFTDLRVAYAALTYKLYGNESSTSNEALERQMQAWLAQCLPLTKLSRSRAFLTHCSVMYLAFPQSPAACHRAVSVAASNHDQHVAVLPDELAQRKATGELKQVKDAHSTVLKVLPLLVRMYCKAEAA